MTLFVFLWKLIFAFNRLMQLFLSDIVPSSLMNFEIDNSILRFSIFSQTVQFRLKTVNKLQIWGLKSFWFWSLKPKNKDVLFQTGKYLHYLVETFRELQWMTIWERVDYIKCSKIVYKSLFKQLSTRLYTKNIIVFKNNILRRQNSASVEYKLYIKNFTQTPSDTLPLVYGMSLMIRP